MDFARANSEAATAAGWKRTAAGRNTFGAERSPVDPGHRSAMAGAAEEVPSVSDLPPPLSALGTLERAGAGAAGSRRAVAGRGPTEPRRSLHRRHLCGREKRGLGIGPTKRGKGTKITAITAGDSLPIAVSVQAASPHESQLVEEALGNSFLGQLPARLIGDKAYESDPLDHHLRTQYDIEMIAPHRGDRKHPTQDGRPLRRYRRRWTVERLFAWLQNFRRLVTRWEYHVENFFGMVRLGCMKIMLRYF